MSNYILAYHGGVQPKSPEEGMEHMVKWKAWAAGLGDALTMPGAPLGQSKTVSASGVTDGGGVNPLSGYSVLKANNLDEAIELVMDCPHLSFGTLEVAEMMDMPMD